MDEPLTCTPKALDTHLRVQAAEIAREENPANHPALHRLAALSPGFAPSPLEIAVVTTKYWRGGGVRLTVGFMDNPPDDLRARILLHMNAWGKTADVQFVESKVEPKVRISRGLSGYWSYLGTDILLIDKSSPTMNLQGFTMQTPDSEFHRVVRHETGHTLGCPHEHMRAELVAQIDPAKAIEYFGRTQGWTADQVRAQVLTPLEQGSIWGTDRPDMQSIMCYQIPGALTRTGHPILGGSDIDESDYSFMGRVYPKPRRSSAVEAAESSEPTPDDHAGHAHHHHHHHDAEKIEFRLPSGATVSLPLHGAGEQLNAILASIAH